MSESDTALDGITVLDCSSGIAGAYCGRLLATYGARVILVEPPCGSSLRQQGPRRSTSQSHDDGALFLALGAGKESVTLDASGATGADLFGRLCSAADVLIVDDCSLEDAGITWESLHARFPRLVLTDISAFGRTGPYANYEALPGTLYALGGYSYMTGDPDREPLQGPENVPGYMAAATAYAGVVSALFVRGRTGAGQRIEVSAMEALAAAHQWTITRYEYNGRIQPRNENRYDSLHPVTYYACADGTVAVSPSTPDQLDRMMLLIGREELLEDTRFSTNISRIENADAFDAEVAPWFMARTRAEITEACQTYRVPCAPALEIDELIEHQQLVARGYWRTEIHPAAGALKMAGPPFRMPGSRAVGGRAPMLGEHSEAIYAELTGLDAAAVAALREAGSI